jgi:hypothetical protein
METIRNLIKKILREVHGKQLSVDNFSEIVTKDILEKLKRDFDKINDGHVWEVISQTYTMEEIKEDTKLTLVKIKIDFKFSDQFNLSGNFLQNNTVLLDDDGYEVVIKLNLSTNNLENLFPSIYAFMSHELNHAFVHIKQIKGKSKAGTLNSANKLTKGELGVLFSKNPSLKEFSNMVYLSNPFEVQARVQQAAAELKHIAGVNANETINALLGYNPLRDAKLMIAYNLDNINKTDKETLDIFVKKFNDNIKLFSKEENPKIISETDKFFEYWLEVINLSGDKLAKKIFKLVADKHSIHEGFVYQQADAYYKIFGEYF